MIEAVKSMPDPDLKNHEKELSIYRSQTVPGDGIANAPLLVNQCVWGSMKTIGIVFGSLLLLLANGCVTTDISGSIVPPFPQGWTNEGGACVAECEYTIGVLGAPNGLMLYFGESASRIDPKKARWLVTDQMPYPQAPVGHQVVYSGCERNGKLDETIIAIVKTTDTEWYSTVLRAYRANLDAGRFEETSTKGVRCLNEGWGV